MSRQIDSEDRPFELLLMDHLNQLPKYEAAGKAPSPITLSFSANHKVWWLELESKGSSGYGYCYQSLREAVRRWNIEIVGWDNGTWRGIPRL